MKKSLLILLALLTSTVALAQTGGVQGKVVSRMGREAVGGTRVTVMPGEVQATTDNEGRFELSGLDAGEYELSFEALDFEPLNLIVRVDDTIRDINLVILAPEVPQSVIDEASFADFDADFESSGSDGASAPTSLSASRDVFSNVASYRFSEMRFNTRGYDSQYQDIYLNGMRFNDALTGFGPWSLWTGLNDATRNQNVTTGLTMSDFGLGGVAGTTNINARASQLRQGLNTGFVTSNQMYRFRVMATYASGLLDNGWSYAFSVSTRQGRPDYVDGVYYNTFAYFGSVEKILNPQHRLGFTIMGSPTQRGAQQASTQEAYDLVGSNYYNPNVGYQRGKIRNTRVRNYHEPIAMLTYTFDITDRTQLNVATALRFGQNGYSALTWYGGPDPRPDYYRNLPSYVTMNADAEDVNVTAAELADRWMHNVGGTRYFDFDQMYKDNRENRREEDEIYGVDGSRAIYMIEERHTDQLDWNFATQFSHLFRNNTRLNGGLALRANRTAYYSEVKDLLGADYWADVDKFAERDFPDEVSVQNDLDYYDTHGHARAAKEGDKYSYNYRAHVRSGNLWGAYNARFGGFTMNVGGEIGGEMMWREGIWRKGLFPDNSKGKSEQLDYLTYKLKGNFEYVFNANHSLSASVVYLADAPTFQTAFVSPRTRNSVTPGLSTEKVFGLDATYEMRYGDLKLRASGYYTKMTDGSRVISFYDDSYGSFVNFVMSGIDKRYYGVEFAAQVPIYMGISAVGAVSWGEYTYDSNPYFEQFVDNKAESLGADIVYWKGMRIESTPQLAATVGLSYRSPRNLFASVNVNYYDNMYLSMNPLYRTDGVILPMMVGTDDIKNLRTQEKFDGAFTLSASIGKNWRFMNKYTLGVSLEMKNILNSQNIKTGGYEQMRLQWVGGSSSNPERYKKFDPKYFYMIGTNYYLNIYFRF